MNFILYTDDLLTATNRNRNLPNVKQQAKLWPVWVAEKRCVQDWLQNYFVRCYHAHVHMMGSSSTNSNLPIKSKYIKSCH